MRGKTAPIAESSRSTFQALDHVESRCWQAAFLSMPLFPDRNCRSREEDRPTMPGMSPSPAHEDATVPPFITAAEVFSCRKREIQPKLNREQSALPKRF
jgi:hypothetical protein